MIWRLINFFYFKKFEVSSAKISYFQILTLFFNKALLIMLFTYNDLFLNLNTSNLAGTLSNIISSVKYNDLINSKRVSVGK